MGQLDQMSVDVDTTKDLTKQLTDQQTEVVREVNEVKQEQEIQKAEPTYDLVWFLEDEDSFLSVNKAEGGQIKKETVTESNRMVSKKSADVEEKIIQKEEAPNHATGFINISTNHCKVSIRSSESMNMQQSQVSGIGAFVKQTGEELPMAIECGIDAIPVVILRNGLDDSRCLFNTKLPEPSHVLKSPNIYPLGQEHYEKDPVEKREVEPAVCDDTHHPTKDKYVGQTSSQRAKAGSIGTPVLRRPKYADMEARKRSYNNNSWPSDISQTPQQLAEAGFFYTGYGDICRCFTCEGGLKCWDPQDDTWIEHIKWFPHCAYVRRMYGDKYVNMVHYALAICSEDEEPVLVCPPQGQDCPICVALNTTWGRVNLTERTDLPQGHDQEDTEKEDQQIEEEKLKRFWEKLRLVELGQEELRRAELRQEELRKEKLRRAKLRLEKLRKEELLWCQYFGKEHRSSTKKMNVNYQDGDGMSGLHQAALNTEIITLLLENYASLTLTLGDNKDIGCCFRPRTIHDVYLNNLTCQSETELLVIEKFESGGNLENMLENLGKLLLKHGDQGTIYRQNLKFLTHSQVEIKSVPLNHMINQNSEILKLLEQQYLQNKHMTLYIDFDLIFSLIISVPYSTISLIFECEDEVVKEIETGQALTEEIASTNNDDEEHLTKYLKDNPETVIIDECEGVSQNSSAASKVEPFYLAGHATQTSKLEDFEGVVQIRKDYSNQQEAIVDLDEKVKFKLPPKVFIDDACDSETGKFTDGEEEAEDVMVTYQLPEKLWRTKKGNSDSDNVLSAQKELENTNRNADVDQQANKTEVLTERKQATDSLNTHSKVKKEKLDEYTLSTSDNAQNVTERRFDRRKTSDSSEPEGKSAVNQMAQLHEPVTATLRNRNPEKNRTRNHFYQEVVDLETKQKKGKKRYNSEESANGKDHVLAIRHLTWLTRDQLPVPKIDIQIYRVFDPLDNIFKKMAQDETPGPEITMQYELLRLCTLRNYPKDNKPFIIRLAGAGFYYAADGDEVVCYCCGLRRHGWEETDVPLDIHRRISSNCNFLTKNAEVNVPVPRAAGPESNRFAFLEEPEGTTPSRDTSEDVSNECSFAGTPNSSTQRQRRPGNFVRDNGEAQVVTTSSRRMDETIGVNTAKPKHPEYAVKTLRLNSFVGWPDNLGQTAETMADAGFYYAGVGDCVRCFFCGIGLRHWTAEDNPWIEHARWSRQCVYLTQIKGAEFVQLVHMAMQYTSENEAQSTETPGSTGNQLPTQELERILLTDAAQSVLEMGYQPRDIKKAIELVVREHGREGVTSQRIMERILELEEAEESRLETGMQQLQVASGAASRTVTEAQAAPAAVTATPRLTVTAHSATADNSRETATSANSLVVVSGATNSKELTGASGVTSEKSSDKKEPQKKKSKELSTDKDPKSIKAENEKLKEQTLCKVCLDNTVCIVFLPCGHLVTCAECAPAMRKCPICRALVKGTVKTFLS